MYIVSCIKFVDICTGRRTILAICCAGILKLSSFFKLPINPCVYVLLSYIFIYDTSDAIKLNRQFINV